MANTVCRLYLSVEFAMAVTSLSWVADRENDGDFPGILWELDFEQPFGRRVKWASLLQG